MNNYILDVLCGSLDEPCFSGLDFEVYVMQPEDSLLWDDNLCPYLCSDVLLENVRTYMSSFGGHANNMPLVIRSSCIHIVALQRSS